MDNFFEILIPIVFFLIWIVSSLRKSFNKSKRPSTETEPTPLYPQKPVQAPEEKSGYPPFRDFHGVDIEKEIQRRIEERQGPKKKPQLSSIPKVEMFTPPFQNEPLSFPLVNQELSRIEKPLNEETFAYLPATAQIKAEDLRLSSKFYQMLHQRESLRSAVILSEILGKPIALRSDFPPFVG